jgi:NAD+ diphosphatase
LRSPSAIVRGGWSRQCGSCGAEHYPRVDPVVIMLAEHDGRVLLGSPAALSAAALFALAGFVEVGESIEAAVRASCSRKRACGRRRALCRAASRGRFPPR